MLQQTQVATVVEYFQRFTRRFPDIRSLAEADEADVMREWEGLGYYRRARFLHAAAKMIVERHGGEFPGGPESIRQLPGIGRYTAGAISSIAFQRPLPILEGNTIRLYSRLLNVTADVDVTSTQEQLWDFGAEWVARSRRPGDINQALMELGNQVCVIGQPRCLLCPIREHCLAFISGTAASLPRKARKTNYEAREEAAIVVRRSGKVLMRQYEPGERWAGLWDFPRGQCTTKSETSGLHGLLAETGYRADGFELLLKLKHAVTKYRIELTCYLARGVRGRPVRKSKYQWVDEGELESLPLSVTGRQIAGALGKSQEHGPARKHR
jgi:A/G-specific adenine glycosylase